MEKPEVGDYTVMTLIEDDGAQVTYLRRVSAVIDDLVQTEVFRPSSFMTTPKAIIKSMHRVIPWHELLNLKPQPVEEES